MELKKYIKTHGRIVLAKDAGTKPIYIYQIAFGYRKAGFKLAMRIERATKGIVNRHDLRPDIFGKK